MRFPKWLIIPFISVGGVVVMAIANDRINIEKRISAVEEFRADVVQRLDRIERKIDRMDKNAR